MKMRLRSRGTTIAVACILAAAAVVTATPSASAAPRWAPASKATIHPGVRTNVSGTTCTTNFVFYDAHAVYLGRPASCSISMDGPYYNWRCVTAGPLGTLVKIEGASRRGTLVYNSLLTTGDTCSANNFALVRIHDDDRGKVNPSVPFWGGPTAGGGRSSLGSPVYSYGYSADTDTLSPKFGIDTTSELIGSPCCRYGSEGGWTRYAHAVSPGMSGDTGEAVLDARGRAFGIVGTWTHDASTRIYDLAKALAYMKATTDLDSVQLAKGTTPFLPPR